MADAGKNMLPVTCHISGGMIHRSHFGKTFWEDTTSYGSLALVGLLLFPSVLLSFGAYSFLLESILFTLRFPPRVPPLESFLPLFLPTYFVSFKSANYRAYCAEPCHWHPSHPSQGTSQPHKSHSSSSLGGPHHPANSNTTSPVYMSLPVLVPYILYVSNIAILHITIY